ncbi:sensor histidine kinase [Paenibacillus sp. LHD-117]|uniref:sensor histidine kinase n=1 Tax=Paenibacillus sp. LHD-117 TaxID=3071412 RepID=UPI0027DEDF43|nr:sensor histidine kinase [Paenibacillus sp. LHD-117]MDQ6420425.1 sensor histidine kinase [Paenibacillus sp. LHD-117]
MKRIRLNTFRARLLMWILLSTLALLTGLTGIFYRYTAQQIDLRVGEAAQRNVSQAMDNFALLARGYDSLTKSIMSNAEIQRLLSREETTPQGEFNKMLLMMGALGTIYYSYNDVKSIHIISPAGNVYSYESTTHEVNPGFMDSEWLKELRQSDGSLLWGGMLGEDSLTVREDPVFTFGRVMTNLYTTRPLGVLVIEADPRTFQSSMNNLMIKPESRTYVYSASDSLLVSSHPGEGESAAELTDLSRYPFRNQALDASDSDHLIVTAEDPKLEWKLLSITPKPVAKVEQAAANRYFVIVTIGIVILAVAIAVFLSRSVSRPIKTIVQEMRRVERGDLSTQLKSRHSYEEINYLNNHFNRMVSEINGLVERNIMATASEKNAQIHALQSQVNPHFLYNTLDMIYWLLDEQENEKLANLVLSLSRMFRYSSDWRSSSATLGEELEQINHYMTIISARSDGRFHIERRIDEELLLVQLPKMTLQPLIENAVIHGLSARTSDGTITITASREGQTACIHIHDDGSGITEDKLKELQRSLRRAEQLEWNRLKEEERESMSAEPAIYGESGGSGAGFLNVHRRLVLEYGAGYGLRIDSEVNVGTTVTVMAPTLMVRT